MAIVWNTFTQPSNVGELVSVQLIGEPVLNRTEIVRFIKFGEYQVDDVQESSPVVNQYRLRLTGKYATQSTVTIPAGTVALVDNESSSISNLPYNPVIYLNFKEAQYRNLLLSGNVVFAAQYHFPGQSISVRIRNLSGVSSRNLSFPTSWIFLGAGRPTTIGPSKTGILSITSFATSDADVVAVWSVQN